jgi:predicted AAA+ superfamily ATPase
MHKGKLIILDEIQRMPEIFKILRGIIDERRRQSLKTGQFLILGSSSLELIQQSSESLAGRMAYTELTGFTAAEIKAQNIGDISSLWLRGGFPDSFLARSDQASLRWRTNFISTYLERDIPQLAPRIPAITLRRLWTMLAHSQGAQSNMSALGASLEITSPTVKKYVELLEDLLLIRSLRPWSGNVGKRLVRTPKIYIRDSGLSHALLNIQSHDDLLAHPVAGSSWEGFVIENLLSVLPEGISYWFYRTAAGAEIDLVLERNSKIRYAIEIKRSSTPVLSKGFHLGCEDIKATKKFVIYPGLDKFPLASGIYAMPLLEMMQELTQM